MDIDYSDYSLQELEEVIEHIDKEKYPERFTEVLNLIREKSSPDNLSSKDAVYLEEKKGLDSQIGCEKIILTGVFGGIFVTLATLVMVTLGVFTSIEDFGVNEFNDPILFAEVILLAALTFFMFKKSRVAATFMFIYYSVSQFSFLILDLEGRVSLLGVLLILAFFSASLATFIWHSRYKNNATKG